MLVIATVSTKEMHVSFRLVSSCKYQVGAMASQLSSSLGGQVPVLPCYPQLTYSCLCRKHVKKN